MLEIGDIFGINTDLRINHSSIPYPESATRRTTENKVQLVVILDWPLVLVYFLAHWP